MSGWHIDANQIRIVKIRSVKAEASKIKTLTFEDGLCSASKPGQFVMVWIPGVDEVPMSLSSRRGHFSSVTVREVGEATRELCGKQRDDLIGIRGPFGNGFEIGGKRVLVIGGGTGTSPLMMLIDDLVSRGVKTTFVEGAKTHKELIFLRQLGIFERESGVKAIFTTDDGTYGRRGLASDAAEEALSSTDFDMIYACGNEAMTRKILFLAKKHKTPLQASLERIMLCGIGICGSCVVGRYRVCKDGPVFNQSQLEEIEGELGKFKRDFKGELVRI